MRQVFRRDRRETLRAMAPFPPPAREGPTPAKTYILRSSYLRRGFTVLIWINTCGTRAIETWPWRTAGQADQGAMQVGISKHEARNSYR
jgi:hypothetical protein